MFSEDSDLIDNVMLKPSDDAPKKGIQLHVKLCSEYLRVVKRPKKKNQLGINNVFCETRFSILKF